MTLIADDIDWVQESARIHAKKAAGKCGADADDLAQEILVALLQAERHYDAKRSSPRTYMSLVMSRVANRLATSTIKRNQRHAEYKQRQLRRPR